MADCCKLVGNFLEDTGMVLPGCIISVSNNINTDYSNAYVCNSLDGGATIGSLNISGYVDTGVYQGCQGSAGVQILWNRKYDGEVNTTYFIYNGPGRSFEPEDGAPGVTLIHVFNNSSRIMSASSQSGPSSQYSDVLQTEGVGMDYSGGPINFNTDGSVGCTVGNMGIGTGDYYLQNFRIELVPGSIPVASYTFSYNV